MENIIDTLSAGLISYITLILRFVTPILSGVILYRCGRSFLSGRAEDETWGYLCMPNGGRIPLNHWENIIGRNRSCDALMEYPTVSRNHGALIRDSGEDGRSTIQFQERNTDKRKKGRPFRTGKERRHADDGRCGSDVSGS